MQTYLLNRRDTFGGDWRTGKGVLIRNTNYLRTHPRIPREFIRDVAALPGSSAERLAYTKNKGARDVLTTRRIRQGSHRLPFQCSWSLPKRIFYDEPERDVLRIAVAQFDQLLFLHYRNIKEAVNRD